MKSYIILFSAAIAVGSMFSSEHSNNTENIIARGIDPKTMDSARLSVLSVLKTAIPCSAHYPKPTGNWEAWYSELPADVKALLPSLYPASSTASSSASVSSTSCSSSPTVSVSVAQLAVSDIFTAACSTSYTTVTTHLTLTKTLHYTPSATAMSNSSRVIVASNGTVGTLNSTSIVPSPTNGSLHSASPKPSRFTAGAEKSIETETIAVFAWVGVAAGFFLFA